MTERHTTRIATTTRTGRAPVWGGAVVLGVVLASVLAACGDAGGSSLLGGAGGGASSAGPSSDAEGGGPGSSGAANTPPFDGGIFAEAGPEASKAETLFRALQNDLVAGCGGTNGVCHVLGAYQNSQTPKWLAGPDAYVSIHSYPGIIVPDPYSSKLIVKGPHAGPGFTGTYKDLGDRVMTWLNQEALVIKVQPLPSTDVFDVVNGPNSVDIGKGGTGVTGAKITFDAAIAGPILTLTNLKLVAPATAGIHIAHPIFTRVLASGKAVDDPVDSFSNLDQTQGAGSTQPLGIGTLILSTWNDTDKMKIGFSTLAAAVVPDAGATGGGCKSVTSFTANAVPAIQQNNCLNCHDQGGNGNASLDLSQVGKDDAKACAQALNRVNLGNKAQSAIIQAPTGGVAAHPFKNASGTYTTMMLAWMNNE